jgi:hypothetical protein
MITAMSAYFGFRYRITHVGLIPSIVHQIVNHPNAKDADLSSLEFVICAAAYLPPQLSAQFSRMVRKEIVLNESVLSYAVSIMITPDGRLSPRFWDFRSGEPSTGALKHHCPYLIVRTLILSPVRL